MPAKDALLVPAAFLALLLGIVAVLVGLWGTAECVAEAIATSHLEIGCLLPNLALLALGIAVLDLVINRWRAGKMRIGGPKS